MRNSLLSQRVQAEPSISVVIAVGDHEDSIGIIHRALDAGIKVVVPSTPADVQSLLDEWPGIPEACGSLLMSLAGMAGNERGK